MLPPCHQSSAPSPTAAAATSVLPHNLRPAPSLLPHLILTTADLLASPMSDQAAGSDPWPRRRERPDVQPCKFKPCEEGAHCGSDPGANTMDKENISLCSLLLCMFHGEEKLVRSHQLKEDPPHKVVNITTICYLPRHSYLVDQAGGDNHLDEHKHGL